MKRRGGFTFIEILIVVIVLGILSGLALLKYIDLKHRALSASATADLQAVRLAAYSAWYEHGTWPADVGAGTVPAGLVLGTLIHAFWRPEQRDVLMPFTARYLEEIPKLAGGGMLKVFGLIGGMFPNVGDQELLDAATEMARSEGVDPTVRAAASSCSGSSVPSDSSRTSASSTRASESACRSSVKVAASVTCSGSTSSSSTALSRRTSSSSARSIALVSSP